MTFPSTGPSATTRADASENDRLVPSVIRMMEAIQGLISDAGMLSKAAVEGKLAARADAAKHQGDFRKIVEGMNDTLDAVIGPLNVAAEYIDSISKGDIPPKITDSYNGDFNEIKNNLNQCIDGLGGLVEANEVLQKMADERLHEKGRGQLRRDIRGSGERHQPGGRQDLSRRGHSQQHCRRRPP